MSSAFTGDMTVKEALELHPGLVHFFKNILIHPRFHGYLQSEQKLREVAGRMEMGTRELTAKLNRFYGKEVVTE